MKKQLHIVDMAHVTGGVEVNMAALKAATTDNVNDNVSINNLLNHATEKKQLVGVYFEPEIAELLKKVSNKRGDQSKIVNEAVRRLMQANGLM